MTVALWYASRATGLVSLLLLTGTLLLGVCEVQRLATASWPRFVVALLHRNLALLTMAFLAIHVTTAIVDPYAGIGWLDAVVPFGSGYHPFWLGLGAVALDLLLALLATSLLRPRISYRTWRAVHWAGYACWPVAVAHGLGIGGADSRLGWVLTLTISCILVVAAALAWRIAVAAPEPAATPAAPARLP
ncbi:MAG: ferric reductase-like transmembrane domain-containing protein [Pseudonocardiaceae bacterium]